MPNDRDKNRNHFRLVGTVAALLFILGVVVSGGVYLVETSHADRDSTQRVKKEMSYSEVVDVLGVMYDRSYGGEYDSTDEVIAKMENGESVSFVCDWRIRFSRDVFYIGFNEDEVVVETMNN